ncbi:hypothetical protein Cflav_PD2434 [Pedosphaera parvula Ellin514]|uniref:O-methyltransferase-like protein n=2 Tax=Pedosphaera TaxID=1032526 RepID=B9XKN4_PEDPL|nr:hypothetical protein Cflav_PD2434 [Pedosphaera parvula Ellin514]
MFFAFTGLSFKVSVLSMSITGFLYAHYWRVASAWMKKQVLKTPAPERLTQADWPRSLKDPTGFYLECFRFFHQRLPAEIREHRTYFSQNRRGFGEDAMHVMWYSLFETLKPANFLEIGVYRGQTTSLVALLARLKGVPCTVFGISPFSTAGDAVSKYDKGINYYEDTLTNFRHFSLRAPILLKAYSTDVPAKELIKSQSWDLIYIDGNHDYEIALQDWQNCSESVKAGGVIVLDDSGLTTAYRPPLFATGGHPGPSRLAQEIDTKRFREILQVGHNRVFQKIA